MKLRERERKFQLVFNLEQPGLLRVLKLWQAEALRFLWGVDRAVSREVWEHLQDTPTPMSRAAVISFLDDMEDLGFVEVTLETGKGGYHRVYRATHRVEGEFRYEIAKRVREAVEAFLGEEKKVGL